MSDIAVSERNRPESAFDDATRSQLMTHAYKTSKKWLRLWEFQRCHSIVRRAC